MRIKELNICIDCQNATGGCSWSMDFEPVKGWTAEKRNYKYHDLVVDTYYVTQCPLFVHDEENMKKIPMKEVCKLISLPYNKRFLVSKKFIKSELDKVGYNAEYTVTENGRIQWWIKRKEGG